MLDAWARQLDPQGKIEFYSDGNLDFARALRLDVTNRALFLGQRSQRYLMSTENGVITRLKVEPDILRYSCTRSADAMAIRLNHCSEKAIQTTRRDTIRHKATWTGKSADMGQRQCTDQYRRQGVFP